MEQGLSSEIDTCIYRVGPSQVDAVFAKGQLKTTEKVNKEGKGREGKAREGGSKQLLI